MQDLKARTKKFALDVILYCRTLPADLATRENPDLKTLLKEADELVAILTSSRKTARG